MSRLVKCVLRTGKLAGVVHEADSDARAACMESGTDVADVHHRLQGAFAVVNLPRWENIGDSCLPLGSEEFEADL